MTIAKPRARETMGHGWSEAEFVCDSGGQGCHRDAWACWKSKGVDSGVVGRAHTANSTPRSVSRNRSQSCVLNFAAIMYRSVFFFLLLLNRITSVEYWIFHIYKYIYI